MKFFTEDKRSGFHRGEANLTGVSISPNGKPSSAVLDIRTVEQQFVRMDFYSDAIAWRD